MVGAVSAVAGGTATAGGVCADAIEAAGEISGADGAIDGGAFETADCIGCVGCVDGVGGKESTISSGLVVISAIFLFLLVRR